MTSHPVIAVIAPGAMGAAVAARLTHAGCTVLTNLDGRSPGTIERAKAAGMQHVSFSEIVERVDWVLSILPPSDAVRLSTTIYESYKSSPRDRSMRLVYVDCNAVNPETARSIAAQWKDVKGVVMLDAGIIGGPPSSPQNQDKKYDPTIYASGQSQDLAVLKEFVKLGKEHNVKIVALEGEGASVGDASALKMSYAGIAKGLTGLITTMLLSAHASSPATADALLNELNQSQPMIIKRLTSAVPDMLPKAYRFSGEMEEIAGFVGNGVDPSVGQIYNGIAKLYERVDASVQNGGAGEVEVLKKLVEQAKKL